MAFGYYRQITVDHTKCGSADFVNLPVLVSISGDASLKAFASGGRIRNPLSGLSGASSTTMPADLVFSSDSAGTTKYPWEIESYNSATGDLLAWVLLPAISVTVDTVFYMAYGDVAVTTAQNTGSFAATLVWADHKFVAHFSDNATFDSSATPATGVSHGSPPSVAGQIGKCAQFTQASSQYIDWGSPTKCQLVNGFTMSIWAKCTITGAQAVFRNQTRATTFRGMGLNYDISATNCVNAPVANGTTTDNNAIAWVGLNFHDSVWRLLHVSFFNGAVELFVNGVSQGTRSSSVSAISYSAVDLLSVSSNAPLTVYFNGALDEARITNFAFTSSRAVAEYNNQFAPGNTGTPGFLIYGAEINTGAGGPTFQPSWARGSNQIIGGGYVS